MRNVLSTILRFTETETKNHAPGPGISVEGRTAKPETLPPGYILDIYIYMYIYIYIYIYMYIYIYIYSRL